MLKLCRKDTIASLRFWLLLLLVYSLYGVNPYKQAWIFHLLAVGLFAGMLLMTLGLEDRLQTGQFISSLPVGRGQQAKARFLLGGLLIGFVLLYSSVYMALLKRVKLLGMAIPPGGGRWEWILFQSVVDILLLCLILPLYCRLGLGRMCIVLGGFFLILFGVGLGVGRMLGFTPDALFPAFGNIVGELGVPLSLLLLGTVLAGLVYASIRLAVRFYQKREF